MVGAVRERPLPGRLGDRDHPGGATDGHRSLIPIMRDIVPFFQGAGGLGTGSRWPDLTLDAEIWRADRGLRITEEDKRIDTFVERVAERVKAIEFDDPDTLVGTPMSG